METYLCADPSVWFAPKWDLYFGMMFNQVHGGLAFGFFEHSNIDPRFVLQVLKLAESSAVRQRSIADITFSWLRLTWPAWL